MALSRVFPIMQLARFEIRRVGARGQQLNTSESVRTAYTTKHGIILQEPQKIRFGILKVFLTVATGLFIGAAISKNIANFLEENDLFVPADDDDDDD